MKPIRHNWLTAALLVSAAPAWASHAAFTRITPVTEPVPAAGDEFGAAQSNGATLSADDRYALVAAPFAAVGTATGAGKAYIYGRVRGSWRLLQEIDDPDGAANDNFGYEMALSADGRFALIGSAAAVAGQAHAGKAYLYVRQYGQWLELQEFDDPARAAGDYFGYSAVALSATGDVAVIGASGTAVNGNANAGEAYVFQQSAGWTETAALPDPDGAAADSFGYPLSMSADGTSALVGSQAAVNGNARAGKAYLYRNSDGSWTRSHEFDDPAGSVNDFFGDSGVSLSADGHAALIGAVGTSVNGNAFAGEAYVYEMTANGSWARTMALADPDGAAGDAFGYPVTLARDGRAALIGSDAPVDGAAGAGKAYLFVADRCSWTRFHEFDDPQARAGDDFGDSGVALAGDVEVHYTAFISAYGTAVDGLANAGEAYFFDFSRWPMQ